MVPGEKRGEDTGTNQCVHTETIEHLCDNCNRYFAGMAEVEIAIVRSRHTTG